MIKNIKIVGLTSALLLSFVNYSWAIYIGGAFVEKKSSLTFANKVENFSSNSYLLNIGSRLPVINDFRFEVQYLGHISGRNKDYQSGLVLYYDFLRFIPIVNPYFGFGIQSIEINFDDKEKFYNKSTTVNTYTFHAGLSASIIIVPIDLYFEYRNSTPTDNKVFYSTKIKSNDFMIGARYYIV